MSASTLSLRIIATVAVVSTATAGEDFCPGFGPDGLTGPCWQPVQANLPDLPPFEFEGVGLCYDVCDPFTEPVQIIVSPPTQTHCAQYAAEVLVTDPGGMLLLRGNAVLDYTRTWQEFSPLGFDYQVWRFMFKVDLEGDWGSTPICPVPSCLGGAFGGYDEAFFYGYVDWALNCQTFEWENAIAMYHNCDAFIHAQGLSDHPGTFHPFTSYGIVGPSTPANPFVPAFLPHPGGPTLAEAVRNVFHPTAPGLCTYEEPLVQGQVIPIIDGCVCPVLPGPPLNTAVDYGGVGACAPSPSAFSSLNLFPNAPWFEVIATSLGRWSSSFGYPGPEGVFVEEGLFLYVDGCVPSNNVDIFYGACTIEGFEPEQPDPPMLLSPNFVDMASNYSFQLPGNAVPPYFGSVRGTEHLFYVNTP